MARNIDWMGLELIGNGARFFNAYQPHLNRSEPSARPLRQWSEGGCAETPHSPMLPNLYGFPISQPLLYIPGILLWVCVAHSRQKIHRSLRKTTGPLHLTRPTCVASWQRRMPLVRAPGKFGACPRSAAYFKSLENFGPSCGRPHKNTSHEKL